MAIPVALGYYDKMLAAIAVSLGGGAAAAVVTPLALHVGMLAGALLSTGFVYLALFRNPPLPETTTQTKTAAVVWHVGLIGYVFGLGL